MKRKYKLTRENAPLVGMIRDIDTWNAFLGSDPDAIYERIENFIIGVKENRIAGFDWEKLITADDLGENLIYFGNADFSPEELLEGLEGGRVSNMFPGYFYSVWLLLY